MPVGRPSSYTPEIAEEICKRIAGGESVRKLAMSEDMPSEQTVFNWLQGHPAFLGQYLRAREARAHVRFELIDQTLEDLRDNLICPKSAQVIIDATFRQIGKENAKRYGEALKLQGDAEAPMTLIVERMDKAK